jgi:hypothetical protein
MSFRIIPGAHVQYLSDIVYYPDHPLNEIVMTCFQKKVFQELAEFCITHHVTISNAILLMFSTRYINDPISQSFTWKIQRDPTIYIILQSYTSYRPMALWKGEQFTCSHQMAAVYSTANVILQECSSTIIILPMDIIYMIVEFSIKVGLD